MHITSDLLISTNVFNEVERLTIQIPLLLLLLSCL